MKLDYQEITPCLKETVKVWEDILSSNIKDASLEYTLREMIKKGEIDRHLQSLNDKQFYFLLTSRCSTT